ncbi:MAG: hypothetical protein ACLGIA_11250 [Actinomycetes bacterium]
MTGRLGSGQASARVQAALGRPPQDALEASVALEAWGGLVPAAALAVAGGTVLRHTGGRGQPLRRLATEDEGSSAAVREVIGLVVTLLATTAWAGPLSAAFGRDAVATGWQVALPVTLALQWLVRRRYLTGGSVGLARLRGDRPVLAVASMLLLGLPVALVLGPDTALAGVLVLTWVAGMLLTVRRWGLGFAGWLVLSTVCLHAGLPAAGFLLISSVVTGALLALAVVTSSARSAPPTAWARSGVAALCGGIVAVLIVADPTVAWSGPGPFPVLALAPSLLAGVWASRHLNGVWTVLVSALSATGVLAAAAVPSRLFGRLVAGALGRLVLGTAALSWGAFAVLDDGSVAAGSVARLLVGLGAFGVVSFVVAVLESFRRTVAALAVAASSVLSAGLAVAGPALVAGWSLPVGALVALLVATPSLVAMVRRPERTLATLL